MAYVLQNRVKQTTTTTGTGTLDLDSGAPSGYRSFVSGIGDGSECTYMIYDGTDFEIGAGTVTAGATDTLSRDTVLDSTNSGNKVNWGSGSKSVLAVVAASQTVYLNTAGTALVVPNGSIAGVSIADNALARSKFLQTNFRPKGYLSGLTISNAADTEHDITVSAGSCRSDADDGDIVLASAMTKRIDANWSSGTGNGGFPSGLSLSSNTTYHVFLIGKTDGTVDAGFDTSLTAANLLTDATDYTLYRRIGSVITDSSSNIWNFVQHGDSFWYTDSKTDVSLTSSIPTTLTATAFTIPNGIVTTPILSASVEDAGDAQYVQFNSSASATTRYLANALAGTRHTSAPTAVCPSNTSKQIYIAGPTATADRWRVYCHGFIDTRGK